MHASRWHVGLFALFLALFFYGLNAQYPLLGHDYFYFFPRLLEGQWYFLRQGLSPLRFAIHLCGGFPQYGNPQDIFYSLPQFFSFFLGLWTASQLSIFIAMVLGYAGWVRVGKDVLRLTSPLSHLLALVCMANGFYFVHIAVGHLSYFTLPLMSWLLWVLLHREREQGWVLLQRAGIAALIVGVFVFSGTHIAPFIILPLFLFLLPFDLLLSPEGVCDRALTLSRRACVCVPLILAFTASKLVAIYSLMRVLPRTSSFQQFTADEHILLFAAKSLWVFPQLPSFFTLDPVNRIHEESMFTSPVVLVGVVLLVVLCVRHALLPRWKKTALLAYAAAVTWFILSVVHATGFVPAAVQALPVLSSVRVPERFLYILALLCSIGGVWGIALLLQKERYRAWEQWTVFAASVLTIVAFAVAHAPLLHSLEYTLPYDQIQSVLEQEPDMLQQPVTKVQDLVGVKVSDFHYIFDASTGPRCYETLHSGDYPLLKDGPVNLAWSGALNVYNPACIHYGEANGCKPGDRVAIDDLTNLEQFINGDPTTWKLSAAQIWADRLTLLTLGMLSLLGVMSVVQVVRRRRRRKN